MSKAADAERILAAAEERSHRTEKVLLELLLVVRARREGLTVDVIQERIGRCRQTIFNRLQTLDEMLELVERKGLQPVARRNA